ncbi:MAG TPA: hypothetical protein VEW66_06085 [Thermomicrobiales bacterium]|nr:hypothetical protein [Thermomicrobiales bacterium]
MSEPEIVKELENISALFVQTAHEVESTDGGILLRRVSPSTIYFSDRPQRVVGHLDTGEFIGFWDDGEDSFGEDPPNAVLAFTGEGAEVPEEIVVTISNPVLDGDNLAYTVEVLDGVLPVRAGACSLFIDPFGRPLSPVSLAGMNRRDRRRDRRR